VILLIYSKKYGTLGWVSCITYKRRYFILFLEKGMADEISIIRAVLDGDVESFRDLVRRYEKPVIKMVKNIIDDHHICEDIAQDVFFDVYKKLNSYDPARGSFLTWVFTIARNKSLNVLKKKRCLTINGVPGEINSSCPTDSLMQREFFEQLDEALRNLPFKQKTAFVLAEFEELPYEQIAQIEGVRIGTIKSRINRAKCKLRIALKRVEGNKS